MSRRPVESPDIRAAAMADLHSGEQPAIVAERYGLDAGKVRMWKTRYVAGNVASSVAKNVAVIHHPALELQQLALGELVMQSLRAKIIATQRIADYASSPEWLDKQTATDVAALFEVIDRSAVSILDRLAQRRAADADQSDEADAD
jgi:hypothetical protein